MRGAGTGSRLDILHMASGECLRLGTDGRLTGPNAGADGFLAKPVLPDALAREIRQVLKIS